MNGTIQKVVITSVDRNNGHIEIGKKPVIVKYGAHFLNKEVLVRITSNVNCQYANFITSTIPDRTYPIEPNQYVLIGILEDGKFKGDKPNFEEVEANFDPGDLKRVLYIREDYTEKKGMRMINKKRITIGNMSGTVEHFRIDKDVEYVIENCLPDGITQSRLIITDTESGLENIAKKVERLNKTPIQIHPVYS